MPDQSPLSVEPSVWQELRSFIREPGDDRPLLGKVLELWCRSRGIEQAALYLQADNGYVRQVSLGSVAFPLHLEEFDQLEESDQKEFARLELPGGLVLHGSAESRSDLGSLGPLDLLLAAASRMSQQRQQLKQQHFQQSYRVVELEALYDVGLAIASTLNLEELSEEILLRAVSLADARRGALFLVDGDRYRLNRTIGGDARESIPADDPQVQGFLQGKAPELHDLLPGATFPLAVPVEIDGKPRGLLVVADKESRRGVGPFVAADRRTLSLFANQAAIALENANLHRQALEKERLERELELAAEIQRGILPKGFPDVPEYKLLGWSRPTRHVGGDYYSFPSLGSDRCGLAVADVTGKGMPAALLVSTLHSSLQLLLDEVGLGEELVARVNQHIWDTSSSNKFITLILAELDPGTGGLRFVNAGHNPGLLVRQDGRVEELGSGGVPLGLLETSAHKVQTQVIERGDLLCLYSDGVTECASPEEEEFGLGRLTELLQERRGQPLGDVLRAIDGAVVGFAAGRPQGDDQTVVLLRRDP